MAVDDQSNATGRANHGTWNALTKRQVYRDSLTAADAADVSLITESIDLRASRLAHSNRIYIFVELIGGASSVTLELHINGFDPVPLKKDGTGPLTTLPAAADQFFLADALGTFTVNTLIRIPTGSADAVSGTYKVRVSAITPGGGSVRLTETHTIG